MIPAMNAAIRAAVSKWPVELQERWNERAALKEYEGRMPRYEAEGGAFLEVDAERRATSSGRTGAFESSRCGASGRGRARS